jgi:hypothetical protein
MSELKLLREYHALCPDNMCCLDLLNEEEKKIRKEKGVNYLTGQFSEAETKNGNGRFYPFNTLKREIDNYQKIIKENRAYGSLDHEDDEVVRLKEASHLVKRLWWEDKILMGVLQLLNTPNGLIAQQIVKDGGQLGISSRALGSLRESSGINIVEDDLILISFDLVSEPSSFGAFLKPQTINENQIRKFLLKHDVINRKINNILEDL